MSGFQEILVIIIIILAILFLPRITARNSDRKSTKPVFVKQSLPLSGRMRLAIVISAAWPLAAITLLEPWQGRWIKFLYLGIAPVAAAWSFYWVRRGFDRTGRRR